MTRHDAKERRDHIMDILDFTSNPPKGQINNLINQIIDGLTIGRVCDKCKHFTVFTSGRRYCNLDVFSIDHESESEFDEWSMGCENFMGL